MKGFIYEYYNSSTNMYYVGQTRVSLKRRDWGHLHNKSKKSHFDNAYQKRPEQFTFRPIVEINTKSKGLLVKVSNLLEESYISIYKNKGKLLYNILKGGNQGWRDTPPTTAMLQALAEGRNFGNTKRRANSFSKEEKARRHSERQKLYQENHPDKYKEIYTNANQRRKEAKREWYLKNKERLLLKLKERRANQKALSKEE